MFWIVDSILMRKKQSQKKSPSCPRAAVKYNRLKREDSKSDTDDSDTIVLQPVSMEKLKTNTQATPT